MTKYGNKQASNFLWNYFSIVLSYMFVSFCWIFFRATNFNNATEIIKGLFSMRIGVSQPYTWSVFALILLIIMSFLQKKLSLSKNYYCGVPIQDLTTIKGQTIFFLLIGITVILGYVGNTAFIYGNF